LDAEGCRGRSIGQFPSYLAKKIIKLALKNNYLKTLDDVEQFSNLCEIDVRYNRIAEGQELLKLYKMRNLTRVYIGGNPFLE
jgi:Leucine-rich repeat (LRR) protein